MTLMRALSFLVFFLLAACSSSDVEKSRSAPSPSESFSQVQEEKQSGVGAFEIAPIGVAKKTEAGFKILLDPASLQIKEICTRANLPYCDFRRQCRGIQVQFQNRSSQPVKIKEVWFEHLSSRDFLIARRKSPIPTDGIMIAPWQEMISPNLRCSKKFSYSADPFLFNTRVRIHAAYEKEGQQKTETAEGIYTVIR